MSPKYEDVPDCVKGTHPHEARTRPSSKGNFVVVIIVNHIKKQDEDRAIPVPNAALWWIFHFFLRFPG
jgi:hypothetical protein